MIESYLNKNNLLILGITALAVAGIFYFLETTNARENSITGMVTVNPLKSSDKLIVYYFWGDGCGYCAKQKPFMDQLEIDYPNIEIKRFETWGNAENKALFQEVASAYGIAARGVPATFIGQKHWVGFDDNMGNQMKEYIEQCLLNGCESKV